MLLKLWFKGKRIVLNVYVRKVDKINKLSVFINLEIKVN